MITLLFRLWYQHWLILDYYWACFTRCPTIFLRAIGKHSRWLLENGVGLSAAFYCNAHWNIWKWKGQHIESCSAINFIFSTFPVKYCFKVDIKYFPLLSQSKCHQYYPTKVDQMTDVGYGMKVMLIHETSCLEYQIRKLVLHKVWASMYPYHFFISPLYFILLSMLNS